MRGADQARQGGGGQRFGVIGGVPPHRPCPDIIDGIGGQRRLIDGQAFGCPVYGLGGKDGTGEIGGGGGRKQVAVLRVGRDPADGQARREHRQHPGVYRRRIGIRRLGARAGGQGIVRFQLPVQACHFVIISGFGDQLRQRQRARVHAPGGGRVDNTGKVRRRRRRQRIPLARRTGRRKGMPHPVKSNAGEVDGVNLDAGDRFRQGRDRGAVGKQAVPAHVVLSPEPGIVSGVGQETRLVMPAEAERRHVGSGQFNRVNISGNCGGIGAPGQPLRPGRHRSIVQRKSGIIQGPRAAVVTRGLPGQGDLLLAIPGAGQVADLVGRGAYQYRIGGLVVRFVGFVELARPVQVHINILAFFGGGGSPGHGRDAGAVISGRSYIRNAYQGAVGVGVTVIIGNFDFGGLGDPEQVIVGRVAGPAGPQVIAVGLKPVRINVAGHLQPPVTFRTRLPVLGYDVILVRTGQHRQQHRVVESKPEPDISRAGGISGSGSQHLGARAGGRVSAGGDIDGQGIRDQ